MKIQAGWATDYDTKGRPETLREYSGDLHSVLQEVFNASPEVLGQFRGLEPTLQEIHDVVDYVNSEGNYHEFIFRIVEV
jgi:hypothetical protein